jgi:hypothetical protein
MDKKPEEAQKQLNELKGDTNVGIKSRKINKR